MSGPTVHTVVMNERTTHLQQMVFADTERAHRQFVSDQAKSIEEAIRQAYVRGVRDGFQQGALAAEEPRT